jgi:hypothetical protein
MSSKWNKYRALLSKEHEAKYSVILADNKEKCKINSDLHDKLRDMYNSARESEEFKVWVRDDNNNNDSSPYTRVDDKLRKIIHKQHTRLYFESLCEQIERARRAYISSENKLVSFRSAVYILYEIPEPKGTPTDDETKTCSICAVNLKDYALPCGHIYCVECLNKMKCECPTCKKKYIRDTAIKLFY